MSGQGCRRRTVAFLAISLAGCRRYGSTASGLSAFAGQLRDAPDVFAGHKAGDQREVSRIKLCWCPPGRFRMGSPPDEAERRPDEAQVDVILTKAIGWGSTK